MVRTPMREISPRPIQPDELAVLRAILVRAPITEMSPALIGSLDHLKVVGLCDCGCKSVYFSPIGRSDRRIADGAGRTASGKRVDVMVWAKGDDVNALDIVDYESSGELPVAESVASFETFRA
jgi:hypothetical protein